MRKPFLVVIAGLIILGGGLVSAQQRVTLEEVSPVWYYGGQPVLPVGQEVTFKLRITNINGNNAKYLIGGLYTVSSPDGATWGTTDLNTTDAFTPEMFSDFLFTDDDPSYPGFVPSGAEVDTVGLITLAFPETKLALYDGFDDVAITITITPDPSAAGKHIVLDAVTDQYNVPTGWEWLWTNWQADMVFPEWGGPYEFLISPMPCGAPEFSESANPTEIRNPYCDGLNATFEAAWTVPGECVSEINYGIVDGPGTIDPVSGVWSWDTGFEPGDLGQTVPLVIEACADGVCSRKTFQVTPTYGVPQFTEGCGETIQVAREKVATLVFAVEGLCPEAPVEFFIADDGGAGGYYYFVDGQLRWDTYFASTGTYSWVVGASTGPDTSYCTVDVVVTTCCGQYTNGIRGNTNCSPDGKINLQDITRLIDYRYLDGAALCCRENGDVNGDGTISLQDITRLVDYIYLSKHPLFECQ